MADDPVRPLDQVEESLAAYRRFGHSEATSLLRWLITRISANGQVTRDELVAELRASAVGPEADTGRDNAPEA